METIVAGTGVESSGGGGGGGGGGGVEATVVTSAAEAVGLDPNNISVVHVSIPNQPVQVQSVIQPTQSVIQHDGKVYRAIQLVTPVIDESDEEAISRNRREILERRPSYRKILNELSESTSVVTKVEEESNSSQTSQESQEGNEAATNLSTSISTGGLTSVTYAQAPGGITVVPTQTIQLAGDGTTQGLQTLTMTNVSTAQASSPAGATIVQYAQGPDGQFFIPAGSVQAYQLSTPTSLPQGVVMATTGAAITSPQQLTEEASRKRELRLMKNREAARECRRKKKDYVKCLENRVAVLENQNRSLIEELKSLKELYCQKEG